MLPFIIVGLVTGAIYGLAGVGLVLTYRTTGILNFAHGAIGAAAAYLFYDLHFDRGMPWPLAMVIAVGIFGPVTGLIFERASRNLGRAPVATLIVATIGLLIAIQGTLYVVYGDAFKRFPQFLPTDSVNVGDVSVTYAQMITIAIAIGITVGLSVFLRVTRIGLAMRAVVHSPELLDVTGTPPAPVRILAWCIGTTMAALSGVLIAPTLSLDAFLLSLIVVQAFGAVAIGRFSSLPLTFIGGLLIGVGSSLTTKYLGGHPPFNGLASSVPFLVLIVVLLVVSPKRLPVPLGRIGGIGGPPRASILPAWARGSLGLGSAAALIMIPFVVGPRLPIYTNALTFVILFLSLSILLSTSGQISLCHAAFVALGASTFSHLSVNQGLPWVVALLGAGLVVVPVGALLSLPAIRLSGLYLALATFGFGILMQQVVYPSSLMFGKEISLSAPRPHFAGLDGDNSRTYYFVVLVIVAISAGVLVAMRDARLGRLLRAMTDSPTALVMHGLTVNVTKLLVFCVSAFFAGIAGALLASGVGTVSRDVGFGPLQSLMWLAVLAMCGARLVPSAFLAAAVLVVAPSYLTSVSQSEQLMIFGAGAVLISLLLRSGIDWRGRFAGYAERNADRHRRNPLRAATVRQGPSPVPTGPLPVHDPIELELTGAGSPR